MNRLRLAVLVSLLAAPRLPAADAPRTAPSLRITLLGTGNPRPMPERYGPAILVEAATAPPTRILVDAGRGAAERRASVMRDAVLTQRIIDHHTTPEDAGRVFSAVKPKLAVYSHIVPSPTTAKDLEGPTRKTYAGPLLVGEDLTVITVGEKVDVVRAAR